MKYTPPDPTSPNHHSNWMRVTMPGPNAEYTFPPLDVTRYGTPEDFDNNFLPNLVAMIEAGNGVAVLQEPEIDPRLPNLWAIIGASGVGKTTLLQSLVEVNPNVRVLKTASSRTSRSGEAKKPYHDLPKPLPGEYSKHYNNRVGIEAFDLLDVTWYAGNVYGLPRRELADIEDGQIPVVGTVQSSLLQLRYNLAGQYNVVTIGIVPRTYGELFDVIESERSDDETGML